jgi:hypothetical protein
MKNCKSKYIIKVDYAVSMKKDNGAENRKRATEKFEFEKILIEKFSGVSLDYISENYTNQRKYIHKLEPLVYNGKYWLSYMNVGLEMLIDKYGIVIENHYDNMYIAIPNEQVEVIEFIKSIQPKWFSTVKKI